MERIYSVDLNDVIRFESDGGYTKVYLLDGKRIMVSRTMKEFDDLLSLSYQDCTTSSAYILNAENANKIQECLNTGFIEMLKGGNPHTYCCDRYWKKIQKDNKF